MQFKREADCYVPVNFREHPLGHLDCRSKSLHSVLLDVLNPSPDLQFKS